jgi:CRISPR-associated endoribonuclease Cas6
MPHAFVLELTATSPNPSLLYPSQYAQGLFYSLLEQVDPNLSKEVHASKQRNPFTLWCKPIRYHNTLTGARLRVTLLDDGLFQPLLQTAIYRSLEGLTLGQSAFAVRRVLATPEGDRDAGVLPWQDLAQMTRSGQGCEVLKLRFITPTVFTTSAPAGDRLYHPLPEPRLLCSSLLRVYQKFQPEPFDDHLVCQLNEVFAHYLEVQTVNIESERTHAGKTKLTGFRGTVTIRTHRRAPEVTRALAALAQLAFYSGVGAKTSYGMGQVRLIG